MGWSDMKPSDIYDASNSFSLTPNLDALAASGTIPQGYYNHQVISLDILATAVEAAELDPSTFTNPIDGVNLVPHIQNNTVAHDFLYWRKMDVWSVVANNDGYKVVVSHEDPVDQTDDIFEMYDLNYSPRESLKNNKFKIHPEETEIFASKKHRNSFKLIRKL
jgi:arylsulfatase A-like enzyme